MSRSVGLLISLFALILLLLSLFVFWIFTLGQINFAKGVDQFAECRMSKALGNSNIGGEFKLINQDGQIVTDKDIFQSKRIQNLNDFYIIHRGLLKAINPNLITKDPENILKAFELSSNNNIEIADDVMNECKKLTKIKITKNDKILFLFSIIFINASTPSDTSVNDLLWWPPSTNFIVSPLAILPKN